MLGTRLILFNVVCSILLSYNAAHAFREDCEKMQDLRTKYHEISSEETLDDFILFTENTDCQDKTPYIASAIMLNAKYAISPFKKLSYFKRGRKMLEKYIVNYPNNIEGRYIRLLTQINTPIFLGYKKNIKTDSIFVYSHLESSALPNNYKIIMRNHLSNTSN